MWQRKRNRVNWLQGKENYFEKMLANDNKVGGGKQQVTVKIKLEPTRYVPGVCKFPTLDGKWLTTRDNSTE